MLQQPLARRVAGAARYAAAGEALPGALPLSSMRRRARGLRAAAVPTDGTTDAWTTAALVVRAGSVLGCPGRPWRSRRVVLGIGAQATNPTSTVEVAGSSLLIRLRSSSKCQ